MPSDPILGWAAASGEPIPLDILERRLCNAQAPLNARPPEPLRIVPSRLLPRGVAALVSERETLWITGLACENPRDARHAALFDPIRSDR